MITFYLADTLHLAQLTPKSGIGARDIILGVLGTFLIAIVAIRGVAAFADERYGKLVTLVLAAIPVAGFCYFPNESISILQGLFKAFVG